MTSQRARGPKSIDWRPAFLAALEETGVIAKAARSANVSRTIVWETRQNDPEFQKGFDDALRAGALLLEAEAVRRAMEGVLRKKFTKSGAPIIDPATGEQYCEAEYSDSILLALLKRHFPDFYREKTGDIHVTNNTTSIVNVFTEAQRQSIIERNKAALHGRN